MPQSQKICTYIENHPQFTNPNKNTTKKQQNKEVFLFFIIIFFFFFLASKQQKGKRVFFVCLFVAFVFLSPPIVVVLDLVVLVVLVVLVLVLVLACDDGPTMVARTLAPLVTALVLAVAAVAASGNTGKPDMPETIEFADFFPTISRQDFFSTVYQKRAYVDHHNGKASSTPFPSQMLQLASPMADNAAICANHFDMPSGKATALQVYPSLLHAFPFTTTTTTTTTIQRSRPPLLHTLHFALTSALFALAPTNALLHENR